MGSKIAIVGAGAVGGYAGAHMVQAGEDVTFIDPWPEHVEHMRSTACASRTPRTWPEFTVPVRALHVTELQQLAKEKPVDIAFVCMKSYDTAWATMMIRQYLAPDGYRRVAAELHERGDASPASSAGARRSAASPARSRQPARARPIHRGAGKGGAAHTVFRAGEVHGRITPAPRRSAGWSALPTAPRSRPTCGASAGRSSSPT